MPGEYVVKRATLMDTLFIIQRGEVDVITENSNGEARVIETMGKGDCIGEEMFAEGDVSASKGTHEYSARAVDFCDILQLHASVFDGTTLQRISHE